MSFENYIAHRYLKTPRKHRSVAIITKLSIIGVALGVMTLIVVLSVMNGFEHDLKGALQGANGHLNVNAYGQEGTPWEKGDGLLDPIHEHPQIKAISAFTTNQALLINNSQTVGSMIKGIDIENETKVSKLLFNIRTDSFLDKRDNTQADGLSKEQKEMALSVLAKLKPHQTTLHRQGEKGRPFRARGILLGSQLARNLGVTIGEFVTVVSPQERVTPMGSVPRAKKFVVVGYFESGIMGYDEVLAYVDLDISQKIYRMQGHVNGFTIQLHDPSQAEEIKTELEAIYPFFAVRSWQSQNANLFAMFELEKIGLAVVLTFIILIAAFNIISSLIMLVMEKQKDIAILKAIGAKDRSIGRIFVQQGAVIGLTGTIIGEILGLCICWVISSFDVIDIPAGVYVGNRIPMHIEIWQISTIAVVSFIICLAVTLIPSRSAARINPVDGLRNE